MLPFDSFFQPTTTYLRDTSAVPWKNGGGMTRELLCWPNRDDWSIRISVADIEQDGPFSAFPGVERYFAVLEGDGVELEGVGVVRAGDAPVNFDGEATRQCRLLGGKTRDLNVMIRREAGIGGLDLRPEFGDVMTLHEPLFSACFNWPEGILCWAVCDADSDEITVFDRSETSYEIWFDSHERTAVAPPTFSREQIIAKLAKAMIR